MGREKEVGNGEDGMVSREGRRERDGQRAHRGT